MLPLPLPPPPPPSAVFFFVPPVVVAFAFAAARSRSALSSEKSVPSAAARALSRVMTKRPSEALLCAATQNRPPHSKKAAVAPKGSNSRRLPLSMQRMSAQVSESRAPTSTTEPAAVAALPLPFVSSSVSEAAAAAAAFFFAAAAGVLEVEEEAKEPSPLPAYLEKHSSRRSGTNLPSVS